MHLFTKNAVDVFAPLDAIGNPRAPDNGETQTWAVEAETLIEEVADNAQIDQMSALPLAPSQVFESVTSALSNGVKSLSIIAGGSGGTDGTFDLAFAEGGGIGASGKFMVSGGAVTSAWMTDYGAGYTSVPTVNVAASSGLIGATVTASLGLNVGASVFFGVPQVTGYALNLYQNVGGAADFIGTMPYQDGLTITQAIEIAKAPLAVQQLPPTVLVDINPVDAQFTDAKYVPGRTKVPTSRNMYAGLLINGSYPLATRTEKFAFGADGASMSAHRLQFSLATESETIMTVRALSMVRFKVKVKSTAGAGTQSIKAGLFNTAMTVFNITEADWTDIDLTFIAGSADQNIVLWNNGTLPLDFLYDYLTVQVYETADVIPAYTDEANIAKQYSLVPKIAQTPGALAFSGKAGLYQVKGRIPLTEDMNDPTLTKAFPAATIVLRLREDIASGSFAAAICTPSFGSVDFTEFNIGSANGIFSTFIPGLSSSYKSGFKMVGVDDFVAALAWDADGSELWIDGIKVQEGAGGASFAVPYLLFGGAGFQDNHPFNGPVGPCEIYDRRLGAAEIVQATANVRGKISVHGDAAGAPNRYFMVWDGDSISTSGFVEATSIIKASFAANGAGIGNPDGSSSNTLFERLPDVQAKIDEAKRVGRYVVFGALIGANELPGSGFMTLANLETYFNSIKAPGGGLFGADFTIACTITSRTLAGFDAAKDTFNTALRAAGFYNHLCDFANNPNLGGDGAAANATYFSDGIHPTGSATDAGPSGVKSMRDILLPIVEGITV